MPHPRLTAATLGMALLLPVALGLVPRSAQAASPVSPLEAAWSRLVQEPSLRHSSVSALAVDLTTGSTLASIHPGWLETPASVTKLFTSAAALDSLSPHFRYVTRVMKGAARTSRAGPLYLVGSGDPWLAADNTVGFAKLAAAVALSVHTATRVVGVTSLWQPPYDGVGWSLGDLPPNWGAGASPLLADRSEVWIIVEQGSGPGARPLVTPWLYQTPLLGGVPAYFDIVNRARTGPAGSPNTLTVTREPGTQVIDVRGSIPYSAGTPSKVTGVLSIGHPALFAAILFQQALARDGVRFSLPATVGPPPGRLTLVAEHTSVTLATLIRTQNQFSVNLMAETLFRRLAAGPGQAGTAAASSAFIAQFDQKAGVPGTRVQLDGSGVSPYDETSASQVVALLQYAARQPWFLAFRNSLMHLNDPKNCGFWCQPYQLPAGAQIWVKTGNLANQWNYAGYAETANHQLVAFAILDDGTPTRLNSFHGSSVDQMMTDVADWPSVPMPSGAPAPASRFPSPLAGLMTRANMTAVPGSLLGAAAVNVATGRVVWQYHGQMLMRAGMLPRLGLSAAALAGGPATLPPATVLATGARVGGVLDGSLVLNGNGNPDLTTADLTALAAAVKAAGITNVTGGIHYVNPVSGWNLSRWPGDLPWEDVGAPWAPPSSPLKLDGGDAAVTVSGTRAGARAEIAGGSPALLREIRNHVVTAAGPASVTVNPVLGADRLTLTGIVPAGDAVTVPLAVPDPGREAALSFVSLLNGAGVKVEGPVKSVSSEPPGTLVGEAGGPTADELVSQLLTGPSSAPAQDLESHLGSSGRRDLAAIVAGTPDQVQDWSGIVPENYMTPVSVSALLARAHRKPADQYLTGLLQNALWVTASPEEQAAAGYVTAPNGEVWAVTVMQSELPWTGNWAPAILQP